MKKILIALDYDPTAQKVAETGHDLAKALNGTTILLHVTSDVTQYSYLDYSPIMGFGGLSAIEKDQPGISERLEDVAQQYLDNAKETLGDEKVQTIVRNGEYGEAILATAMEIKADIIVMGTHGRRGLEKILMGSVAENVLRHSSIPILIIPTKGLAHNDTKGQATRN
jgi:nucleotide-binding universal stress UspA family protein